MRFRNTECPSDEIDDRVAFAALLKAGGRGIYTGPDILNDKVISTGETLFGQSLTSVGPGGIYGKTFNDAGQVAFLYTLSNGAQGIALATPVPEPRSARALLLVCGFLFQRSSNRRHR